MDSPATQAGNRRGLDIYARSVLTPCQVHLRRCYRSSWSLWVRRFARRVRGAPSATTGIPRRVLGADHRELKASRRRGRRIVKATTLSSTSPGELTRSGLRTQDSQPGARLFEFPNVFEC